MQIDKYSKRRGARAQFEFRTASRTADASLPRRVSTTKATSRHRRPPSDPRKWADFGRCGNDVGTMWKRCGGALVDFPIPFTGTPARQPAAPKLPFPKPQSTRHSNAEPPLPHPRSAQTPHPTTPPTPRTKPPLEVCLEALSVFVLAISVSINCVC